MTALERSRLVFLCDTLGSCAPDTMSKLLDMSKAKNSTAEYRERLSLLKKALKSGPEFLLVAAKQLRKEMT